MLSLSGGFASVIQALCTFSSLHLSVSASPSSPASYSGGGGGFDSATALQTLLAWCLIFMPSAWVNFFFFFCPRVQREVLCQAE